MPPCDIVIIGHGAAGLCAAVSAAEAALEHKLNVRITVIERASEAEHGGNSRWTPSYIRMPSVAGVAPGFVEDIVHESGGRADSTYFQRLADDAGPTMAWLQGHGVAFHTPVYYLAAEELLLNDDRAVCGVSLDDGQVLSAHRIILASGGFAGNPDMLGEHFGPAARSMKPISTGTRANTGAGIRMALINGAQPAGDWHGMHAEPIDARSSGPAPVVLVYPYGIVVDQNGDRFFDEGAGLVHETWEHFARHIHMALPGHQAYAILDSRLLDIPNYERSIRSEVQPIRADSIPELAALLGIPAVALKSTVSAYNDAATGDTSAFDATHTDGIHTAPGYTTPQIQLGTPHHAAALPRLAPDRCRGLHLWRHRHQRERASAGCEWPHPRPHPWSLRRRRNHRALLRHSTERGGHAARHCVWAGGGEPGGFRLLVFGRAGLRLFVLAIFAKQS